MDLADPAGSSMVCYDGAWHCQGWEDTSMMSTVFPSQSPQRALFVEYPCTPTGFNHQPNFIEETIRALEMSPGPAQISCASMPPVAVQGTGDGEVSSILIRVIRVSLQFIALHHHLSSSSFSRYVVRITPCFGSN
jgi:hypothetical protein